jgi:hypothetical protein
MLRKFVSAVVIVAMIAGVGLAQAKKPGKKGKHPRGKIVKVEGDKITVAVGKKGAKGDKTLQLTPATKYVTGHGKSKKELKTEEGKAMLKPGVKVSFTAGDDGKVQTLHISTGKKSKKPKADKKSK